MLAWRTRVSPSNPRRPGSQSAAVKSAARVLDIFELLLGEPQGLSLTEVSERLEIPLSSTHRLLQTLMAREYLVRRHGAFRLGPRLGDIARVFTDSLDFLAASVPIVERVVRLCNNTVFLATLEGTDVVQVHMKAPRTPMAIISQPRYSAHTTALGKAILAFLSPDELEQLYPSDRLEAATPYTITDRATLMAELAQVRHTGVAHSREEWGLGLFAVGSAIFDHRGSPTAGISIECVAAQVDSELECRLAALVKASALLISSELGYLAPGAPNAVDTDLLSRAWEQGEGVFKNESMFTTAAETMAQQGGAAQEIGRVV